MPTIRPSTSLERGQTTIQTALNSGLIFKPPPRPGPAPKPAGQANTVLGRRIIGGPREKEVQKLFAAIRLVQSENSEPGDININQGRFPTVEEDKEFDYILTKRYAYLREQKLAAIDYFQSTWKEKQDSTYKRLSNRYTSKKLKIICKILCY